MKDFKFEFTEEQKETIRKKLCHDDMHDIIDSLELICADRIKQIVNEHDGWIRVEDGIDYQAVFNKACAFYTEWAHGDSITELMASFAMNYADQSCSAKDAEIAELKRLNESNDVAIHEREVMIQAFKVIREAFESREWITQGRGCYKYNDDRYMEEAKYLFNDFKKIESEMWRQIKSKSYEYKKSIESPLLSKLAELKRRVAELEQNAPKLVLPSVEEMRKYLNGYFGFGGDPSISDREYGFEHGYDYTIDEIKRLNGI